MTYKENDLVTWKLDKEDERFLNDGYAAQVLPHQIIKHEPAPEPIVYWRYWDGEERDEAMSIKETTSFKWDHKEKVIFNPDGTYTVEVVKRKKEELVSCQKME